MLFTGGPLYFTDCPSGFLLYLIIVGPSGNKSFDVRPLYRYVGHVEIFTQLVTRPVLPTIFTNSIFIISQSLLFLFPQFHFYKIVLLQFSNFTLCILIVLNFQNSELSQLCIFTIFNFPNLNFKDFLVSQYCTLKICILKNPHTGV